MFKKHIYSNRYRRIENQIKKCLSTVIYYIRDPRIGMITFQYVKLTKNYKCAKIYFTMLKGNLNDTLDALKNASGYFNFFLSKMLLIRKIPILYFFYDYSIDNGMKVINLINQISKK